MHNRSWIAKLASCAILVVAGAANAAVTTLPAGNYDDPNAADPFEGATGGPVTGVQLFPTFSLDALFGATTASNPYEPTHTVFNGSGDSTFTFTTTNPVTISGYNLYLSGGGTDGRELSKFELLADTGSGFVSLGSGPQTITDTNYGAGQGSAVLVADVFAPVTASSFQVKLTNAGVGSAGGRLTELDAVGVPEPTSLAAIGVGTLLAFRRRPRIG